MSFEICCGPRSALDLLVLDTSTVQVDTIHTKSVAAADTQQPTAHDLCDREGKRSWISLTLVDRLGRSLVDWRTWAGGCGTATVVAFVGLLTALPTGLALVAAQFFFLEKIPHDTPCWSLDPSIRTELFVTSMFTYHLPAYVPLAISIHLIPGNRKWAWYCCAAILLILIIILSKGLFLIQIDHGVQKGAMLAYVNKLMFFALLVFMCWTVRMKLKEHDNGSGDIWFVVCFSLKIVFDWLTLVTIFRPPGDSGITLHLLRFSWFPYCAGLIFASSALWSRICAIKSRFPVHSQYLVSIAGEALAAACTRLGSSMLLEEPYKLLRLEVFLLVSYLISRTTMVLRDDISERVVTSLSKFCCFCTQHILRKGAGGRPVDAKLGHLQVQAEQEQTAEQHSECIRYGHIFLMEMVFDIAGTLIFYGARAIQIAHRATIEEQTHLCLLILACLLIQSAGCILLCVSAVVPKIYIPLLELSQGFFTYAVVAVLSCWMVFNVATYQTYLLWPLHYSNSSAVVDMCEDPSLRELPIAV